MLFLNYFCTVLCDLLNEFSPYVRRKILTLSHCCNLIFNLIPMSKKKYCQPTLMALSCTIEGEVFAASTPGVIQDGGAFNVFPSNRTPLESFSQSSTSTSSSVSKGYSSNSSEESITDLMDKF